MNTINRQHGVSLPEVMLIMIITVILSTTGLYGWQRWRQQQQLTQTVQQLRQYLEQLRNDANWHNRDHFFWLAQAPQGWCIGSSPTINIHNRCCHCIAARWRFTPPFPGITVKEMGQDMAFYGLRNTAWAGHITLQSPAGEWKVIISNWGRIRTCSPRARSSC